jgi:hypothetical protein
VAYVKRKRLKGRDYYYLVESYRSHGKVKTRTLKYLGRTPEVPEEDRHLLGPRTRRGVQLQLWDPQSLGEAIARRVQAGPAE